MACQAMHFWTFSGLVGAFLDLMIAYFLLCASTFAFFVSQFLGFFGMSLPCPCNGLFGIPATSRNYCFQSLLVDYPAEKLSSVQLSVRSKFPFDSVLEKNQNFNLNMRLGKSGNFSVNGFGGLEGEASCNSQIVDGRESVSGIENDVGFGKDREFDMKGKGGVSQRPRGGSIRRRRKGGSAGGSFGGGVRDNNGKLSSVSSASVICKGQQSVPDEKIEGSSQYEGEASKVVKMRDIYLQYLVDKPADENDSDERIASSVEESRINERGELGSDGDVQNAVRVLEQELEEEHAARAMLYLELEKERSAAATAADEAMAMILRLQEEKASIEMEARQFQRIIEEKSTYDTEEMNILKEILLRREKEKHFLEKEVEAYRQMVCFGNVQFQGDFQNLVEISSLELTEDPDQMLRRLNETIENKKLSRNRSSGNEELSISNKKLALTNENVGSFSKQGNLEKQFEKVSECIEDGNQEILEKETYLKSYESSSSLDTNLPEKTISVVGEEQEQFGNYNLSDGVSAEKVVTSNRTETHIGESGQSSRGMSLVSELRRNSTSALDCSEGLRNDTESGQSSRGISLVSELRRNSTSALDSERLKIDSEVEWLRERLRAVQEGREKLNLSMEHREKEKLQLQLLGDIASQLREIRLLTEPGKARQALLPAPSPKVMSKKRRSRSVTLGIPRCS